MILFYQGTNEIDGQIVILGIALISFRLRITIVFPRLLSVPLLLNRQDQPVTWAVKTPYPADPALFGKVKA